MPKYVIERSVPGVGRSSKAELQEMAQKSREALMSLGPEIQWLESYVTADKIFCVYHAPSPKIIRKHAKMAGFPADKVSEVASVIDLTTAEAEAVPV